MLLGVDISENCGSFFFLLRIFQLSVQTSRSVNVATGLGPVPSKDMQTLPLSFAPIFMKDAQCVESNKKSIFRFLFFELSWKFIENWQFLVQNDYNSKNKNLKLGLFFYSADCSSSCKFDQSWRIFFFFGFWCFMVFKKNKIK